MDGLALGIDLGTTAVKAAVVDQEGRLVASGSAPTQLLRGQGGRVEQEVEGLWRDARAAVRDALAEASLGAAVRAVSLSSQGGTLILLDETGAPIANAISWMDSRPARLGDGLRQGRDHGFFYEKTGWTLESGALPLAQLLRLRMECPETLSRVGQVHFVDSYVVQRLAGEGVCDPSDAAITMLYNVREGRWDDELLALAGIERGALPRIVASGTPVGTIRREAAEELGISPDATVVAGGHDQYCAAFGAGCASAGDTIVSCGTAWVLLTMTTEPRFALAARLAPARAVSGDLWGLLGSCSGVGAAVDWFRLALSPAEASFAALEAAAGTVEPSADGPLFVPPQTSSQGSLLGFGLHHAFPHVARAVLEGVALSARGLLERMRAAGTAPTMLRAVGGATRSRLWMQILSDVTGLPLEVAGVQEAASYGAARLAGRSAGIRAEKGTRSLLCQAPEGPFRQKAPGAFFRAEPSEALAPRRQFRDVYDQLHDRFEKGRG